MNREGHLAETKNEISRQSLVYSSKNQVSLPTWVIVIFLIAVFILLKSFIYLADEKRKDK